jgi:4-amino-4-deoxy-L-arabinose transferase-like glycosyltransferase
VTGPSGSGAAVGLGARVVPAGETRRFFGLLLLYVSAHAVLRVLVSGTLTIDDSREAVFGQSLEWGYLPRQPPLYNWLVWAAFQVLGTGLAGLVAVKYALLFLVYTFVYLAGRRVLGDGRRAALGAFSLLLVVPVSWVLHESLTHSVAALASAAATFYVMLRLETSGSVRAYLALGLALGLGLLSKFSYAFFGGALILAALTVAPFRRRMLHPRIALTALAVVVLVAPYLAWFYGRDYALAPMYRDEVGAGEAPTYLLGVASGLYFLVRVTLYYVTPLWIVFWLAFRGAWAPSAGAAARAGPGGRLLERLLLAELALCLAGILAGGVTYLKFRWMLPVYFLCPLYALGWVGRDSTGERRLRWLTRVLAAAAVAVAVAFPASVLRGDFLGKPSRLTTPYPEVARDLAAAGFAQGTLIADDGALGGNLRLWFPRARVIRLTNPDYVPATRGGGQCLVAWEKAPVDRVPDDIRDWIRDALGTDLREAGPVRVIDARYRHARAATLRVVYVLLPHGLGRCQ